MGAEQWVNPALFNGVGVVGVVVFVGLLVYFGKLVPARVHREAIAFHVDRVKRAEAERDRWEAVALRALDATERLTEPVETAAKVLTKLPNPAREGGLT